MLDQQLCIVKSKAFACFQFGFTTYPLFYNEWIEVRDMRRQSSSVEVAEVIEVGDWCRELPSDFSSLKAWLAGLAISYCTSQQSVACRRLAPARIPQYYSSLSFKCNLSSTWTNTRSSQLFQPIKLSTLLQVRSALPLAGHITESTLRHSTRPFKY